MKIKGSNLGPNYYIVKKQIYCCVILKDLYLYMVKKLLYETRK